MPSPDGGVDAALLLGRKGLVTNWIFRRRKLRQLIFIMLLLRQSHPLRNVFGAFRYCKLDAAFAGHMNLISKSRKPEAPKGAPDSLERKDLRPQSSEPGYRIAPASRHRMA